jgi:hypothetical protein
MREICTSGSEGGGAGTTGAPYPYHVYAAQTDVYAARTEESRGWPAFAGHGAFASVSHQRGESPLQGSLFPSCSRP